MKKILFRTFILFLPSIGYTCYAQETDAVKEAHAANEIKSDKGVVDDDVATFLVKSADARMMDTQEGKLAIKKATTKALQNYGRWMVKDQAILMKEIKKLAAKRSIALPETMSNKKEDGREDLAEKNGSDFDKKFMKMMIIDHERDIKLFKRAIQLNDQEVSNFAKQYLPTLQAHLDKIEDIENSYNDH